MKKKICRDCGSTNVEWKHTYDGHWICDDCFKKKSAATLGSITTPKKARASRINGMKGGRPKKPNPLINLK